MASKTSSSHLFKSIIPFSQDHQSFYTRLAILSWDNAIFSNLLEAFFLFIEYGQLLSQTILLNLNLEQFGQSWDQYPLYNTALVFAKIFTLGDFMELQGTTITTVVTIAIVITALCLIKYCFIIYAVITAARNRKGSKFLLRIWGLIFRCQGRVIYYLITSFWTKIILSISQDELDLTEGQKAYLTTWSILIIIIEFLLAFVSQAFFAYLLPTKSFLSAKSNRLELITLIQKLVIQICMISPIPKTLGAAWVITILNLAFSIVRNGFFFRRLPYYKKNALYCHAGLQMAVACLGMTYFAHMILRSAYYGEKDINPTFGIICWLVLTLLNFKVTFALLDNTFTSLLTSWQMYSPEILLHKIIAIRELLKNQHSPTKFVTKYKWAHLINTTSYISLANVLNLSPEVVAGLKVDFESKKSLNELFLLYLENLIDIFPKECFIKLYLAYFYGKKLGIYGLSMTLLVSLKRSSPTLAAELNASLLINKMQNILIHSHRIKASGDIDLHTYVKSTAGVAKLKEEIVKQADLQIKLCQEMTQDTAHLVKIYMLAWKIIKQRAFVKQKSKRLYSTIPKHFIELPALIAHYSLILNYSLKTYLKFFKEYDMRAQKYKQSFNKDVLCQDNAFDRSNLKIVLSGRREDLASIIYACKKSYEVYGRDIVGEKGFGVVNPALQRFYQVVLQASLERGDPSIMGRPCPAFQRHKEGYIMPSYFYLNLNPILCQDLYYMVIIRLARTTNEYILLNEDGTIDACTKKIGYDLGILPKKASKNLAHISQLSKELNRVNQAFNMKAFPEKYENAVSPPKPPAVTLNSSQADNIYTIYTTEGKTIRIGSLNPENPALWFNCKVENQMYGSILLKVVLLEKSEDSSSHKVKPSHIKLTRVKFENKTVIGSNTPQDNSPVSFGSPVSPTNPEQSKKLDESALEVTDISRFTKEDEKEHGWIDFDKFQRKGNRTLTEQTPESRSKTRRPTQGSPTQATNLEVPPSSRRKLKGDFTGRERRSEPRLSLILEEKIASVKEESVPVKVIELDHGAKYSRATQSSGVSVQIKITQVFHEAVKVSYIPRFYQIFLLFWYALLITILVNQFRLNLDGTSEMKASNYRKDVMMSSDLRSDSLVNIHIDTRSLADISNFSTPIDPSQDTTPSIINFLHQEFETLRGYNHELLEGIGDFESGFGQMLFVKDIRVIDGTSSQSTNLSSFQAVDRIVETGLKGVLKAQENLTSAIPEFRIVLKNDLSDLLQKSYYISQLILMYATSSTQEKLDSFALSLILTILGTTAMAVIFSILVYLQYKDDLRNMLAFIRIKKSGIKNLMKKVTDFKDIIQNEANLEERLDEDVIRCYHESLDKIRETGDNSAKNSSFGSVNSKGLAIRFYFYAFLAVVLLGLVTGLIAVNQSTSKSSLEGNEQRLYKMSFANDVRLRVGLLLATALEFMSNTTDSVEIVGGDVETSIVGQLEQIGPYFTEIAETFKEPNGEYDPTIQEILYGDPCQYLDGYIILCTEQDSNSVGLLQRLSGLESYINLILDQMPIIDSIRDLNDVANRIVYMRAVFNVIFEVMNDNFDADIEDDVFFNLLLNVVITLSLIIICIGVHMHIFRKVSESHNDFKSILETFPARLVLSNFVLKSYLSRTSKGALDAIKEEI